jgi:hypothetical protein
LRTPVFAVLEKSRYHKQVPSCFAVSAFSKYSILDRMALPLTGADQMMRLAELLCF